MKTSQTKLVVMILSLFVTSTFQAFPYTTNTKHPLRNINNFSDSFVHLFTTDTHLDSIPKGLTNEQLSEYIKEELKKLPVGQIGFNTDSVMEINKAYSISVLITQNITDDLRKALEDRGVIYVDTIQVSSFMKVQLNGDKFKISRYSAEKQIVTQEGRSEWDYDVTPLETGTQLLTVSASVIIKLPTGNDEQKDYPVIRKNIYVRVTIAYLASTVWRIITGSIYGILLFILAIITPLITYLLNMKKINKILVRVWKNLGGHIKS